jgi:interferon gamma-inducible protein 30
MARVLRLFFFLLLSAALVPPPSAAAAEGPAKVSLALYYESLCPYCSRFIVNHLAGIFDDGLIDAVDLLLVPYGNAHVRGTNNTINCQVMSAISVIQFPFPHESSSSLPVPSIVVLIELPCLPN